MFILVYWSKGGLLLVLNDNSLIIHASVHFNYTWQNVTWFLLVQTFLNSLAIDFWGFLDWFVVVLEWLLAMWSRKNNFVGSFWKYRGNIELNFSVNNSNCSMIRVTIIALLRNMYCNSIFNEILLQQWSFGWVWFLNKFCFVTSHSSNIACLALYRNTLVLFQQPDTS